MQRTYAQYMRDLEMEKRSKTKKFCDKLTDKIKYKIEQIKGE